MSHCHTVPASCPNSRCAVRCGTVTLTGRSGEADWVQADFDGSQDQLSAGAAGPSAGKAVLARCSSSHMLRYPSLNGIAWPLYPSSARLQTLTPENVPQKHSRTWVRTQRHWKITKVMPVQPLPRRASLEGSMMVRDIPSVSLLCTSVLTSAKDHLGAYPIPPVCMHSHRSCHAPAPVKVYQTLHTIAWRPCSILCLLVAWYSIFGSIQT